MNRSRSALALILLLTSASAVAVPALSATPSSVRPASQARDGEESTLPADHLETRHGVLAIEKDPDEDSTFWATLDGERVVKLEGENATIAAHLGQRDRDVLLLETGSGGIACPMMYRFVELRSKRAPVVSEEFGSCAEWKDAAFQGSKVVIRMPAYTPHPDLLSEEEIRQREHTTLFYTWEKGTVRERSVVRK